MGQYIWRRLLVSIPVLFGITVVTFIFVHVAPGDPISAMINPADYNEYTDEYIENRKRQLGLDKPLPVQYVLWLNQLIRGNLGYSALGRGPVIEMITHRLGNTLKLTFTALLISVVIGISVGFVSAIKQYSLIDYVATFLSFLSISIPGFFLAIVFIYIFALRLDLLPTSGMATLGQPPSLWDSFLHLVLPATVLGTEGAASLVRYTRSSMLEVIRQDYVVTARAKGLAEYAVLARHAFRNGLLPLITVIGLRVPYLFAGAVIIEQIFFWQGLGQMGVQAAFERDYPVLMGLNLVFSILVLYANLITDISYAFADPRIRYE